VRFGGPAFDGIVFDRAVRYGAAMVIVMPRFAVSRVLAGTVLLLAACQTPPPRTWLRYEQEGPTQWATNSSGLYSGRLHGAEVTLDLGKKQTRVLVEVVNDSKAPVELRMGPDGGQPRSAIGEVLLRPLGGPAGSSGMRPYSAMHPVVVEPGWRGTFHLDSPLGRDPIYGQYFVLAVEARDTAGNNERRTLPLRAVNAGTMTADGQ
jgi:hypothetical protein